MYSDATGLRVAKRRCRREILALRSQVPTDLGCVMGGVALWRLFGLPEYRNARTVMAFASFRAELDTTPLLVDVLRSGRVLVLPFAKTDTRQLDLRIVSDLRRLRRGAWNIPEPDDDCPPADPTQIELLVMPGVAFDLRGQRLGYGGGFYDALLRSWPVRAPVACGLAYELQVVPAVPSGPHDQPLELLVTDRAVRRFAKGEPANG